MMDSKPFTWDDDLEGAAKRIAQINHSPLRILAGPGTGKTFSLMRRVARLLQLDQVNPRRLLVCTFTRTAARDLETELNRLGIKGADAVRAGTLHSFCFALLSRADVLQLTGRVPRPLLEFEERFLLEDLQSAQFGGIRDCDRRLQAFNAAWARLQSEDPGWPTDVVDQAFHAALSNWLRFHEAILIGELIPETLQFLRNNPASPYRHKFQHVLVDEYQDLNRAEQELLDLIAGRNYLAIIGDEDQSIYSFKHAHPEGIREFHTLHKGTHDENLDECRRCPKRVVHLANALIQYNTSRQPRTLNPRPSNPEGEVHVLQWRGIREEAEGFASIIKRSVDEGTVDLGRVLVLAPRRQFGYAIRDALNSQGIPAHSFFHEEALDGNPKKIEDSNAQQTFTLLNLLAYPEDRVSLRCWCGFGSPSLRRGAWERLRAHCEQSGESPFNALNQLASGDLILPQTSQLLQRFHELQIRLSQLQGLVGPSLATALFPESDAWAEPLRNLACNLQGDYEPSELLDWLRTGITQPELPTDVDYIRVMSLHKSKGLTADFVVVVGCIQGLIPFIPDNLSPVEYQRALEEQRRLFYVAITRTRHTLILSSVTRLPRKLAYRMRARVIGRQGSTAPTITSSFIRELGPTCPRGVLGTSFVEG